MTPRRALVVAVLVLGGTVPAQELLWTVHSTSGIAHVACFPAFGDFDHDGMEDMLVHAVDLNVSTWPAFVRVLSGADGAVLHELYVPPTYNHTFVANAGDFDEDGYNDVVLLTYHSGSPIGWMEVWSIIRRMPLRQIPNIIAGAYGGATCADLDISGDGKIDLINVNGLGSIVVYDHSGAIRYTIPALQLGLDVFDVEGVGDLDGDGADDFLAGAVESLSGQGLGAVVLFSGLTGTPLRIHFGPYPGAGLNEELRKAGDVDGDGVMDYAAGNRGTYAGLVMIWSGATGVLIRQWSAPSGSLSGLFLGNRDVDLDGRPDIIDIAPAYFNTPPTASYAGRVRALSSRDGQDVVQVVNQILTSGSPGFGGPYEYADLGVQPGNPYPVFAIFDVPFAFNGWPRIRAFRCSPLGTRFVGSGCSSTGSAPPTIGIRRVDGSPTDTSRLVLGSAPPNAIAVCVAAPAGLSSAGGITTPFALDGLGLLGCQLLVPPAIEAWRLTGATGMDRGYAAFDLPVAMAATGGTLLAAQWLVLDPATLAFAATQRYEFRLQ